MVWRVAGAVIAGAAVGEDGPLDAGEEIHLFSRKAATELVQMKEQLKGMGEGGGLKPLLPR